MSTYRVTFKDNKIGRNHSAEPITVEVKGHNVGEEVANAVLRHAGRFLASRFPDVDWSVGPTTRVITGEVFAGFHTVAQWYAEEVEEAVAS